MYYEKFTKVLAYVTVLLSSCSHIPKEMDIQGAKIIHLKKPGIFGNKGVKIQGNRIRMKSNSGKARIIINNPPLMGDNWAYGLQIRFYRSREGKTVNLTPEEAKNIKVSWKFKSDKSDYTQKGILFSDKGWINAEIGGDPFRDKYYYYDPMNFYISESSTNYYFPELDQKEDRYYMFYPNDRATLILSVDATTLHKNLDLYFSVTFKTGAQR